MPEEVVLLLELAYAQERRGDRGDLLGREREDDIISRFGCIQRSVELAVGYLNELKRGLESIRSVLQLQYHVDSLLVESTNRIFQIPSTPSSSTPTAPAKPLATSLAFTSGASGITATIRGAPSTPANTRVAETRAERLAA